MGIFGKIGRAFKKVGRAVTHGTHAVGNIFKKGAGAVRHFATKTLPSGLRHEFYEGAKLLPSVGQIGGSAIGSVVGEGAAVLSGNPELAPYGAIVGGYIGGRAGKVLGGKALRAIEKPVHHHKKPIGKPAPVLPAPVLPSPHPKFISGVPTPAWLRKPDHPPPHKTPLPHFPHQHMKHHLMFPEPIHRHEKPKNELEKRRMMKEDRERFV